MFWCLISSYVFNVDLKLKDVFNQPHGSCTHQWVCVTEKRPNNYNYLLDEFICLINFFSMKWRKMHIYHFSVWLFVFLLKVSDSKIQQIFNKQHETLVNSSLGEIALREFVLLTCFLCRKLSSNSVFIKKTLLKCWYECFSGVISHQNESAEQKTKIIKNETYENSVNTSCEV